jgi:hypothetical protein
MILKIFLQTFSTKTKIIFPQLLKAWLDSGLPDFSWENIPKLEIYTKMTTKYSKGP